MNQASAQRLAETRRESPMDPVRMRTRSLARSLFDSVDDETSVIATSSAMDPVATTRSRRCAIHECCDDDASLDSLRAVERVRAELSSARAVESSRHAERVRERLIGMRGAGRALT